MGCNGAANPGATTPRTTPLAPPAVTVSFVEDAVTVAEGQAIDIAVRYQVNELASPLLLAISPLDQDTTPEDYELSAASFEIPAGVGISGTAAVSFTAVSDEHIAEGDERIALRLVEPHGVRASLDQNLEVIIADIGGNPCVGLRVQGTLPKEEGETGGSQILATTLGLRLTDAAADVIAFDWEGPYVHDESCRNEDCRAWYAGISPSLEATVVEWAVEPLPSATQHSVQVEWIQGKVFRLRFRSTNGSCDPERDRLECRAAGCILTGTLR